MSKRLAILLVLVLMLGMLPVSAGALEHEEPVIPERMPLQTNPLYAGDAENFTLVEIPSGELEAEQLGATYLSVDEAAKQLRSYMVSRTASFTLYVKDSSTDYEELADRMMDKALAHTGSPREGDYLLWHAESWNGEVSRTEENGKFNYTYKITMTYFTTASQEQEVNTAVNSLLNTLKVSNKSDYEKVRAVYDYLCKNVKCVAYAQSNTLNHTAYGALVKKSADSQGIAAAMYRMLLELKVDCRVIAGETDAGVQLWNIAKLGDVYYNLDAAMDAGAGTYKYFLRNSENFADHYRYLDYMSTQFHTDHPMSATDYKDGVAGEPEYYYVMGVCGDDAYWAIDRDRNLTIAGTGATYDYAIDTSTGEIAPWTYWADGFANVIVEEGITALGDNVIYRLSNVKSVTLPDTLEEIGIAAFYFCDSLTKIDIPDNVTMIGVRAFAGCSSLKNVTLGDSVKRIDDYAFMDCSSLVEIYLPDSLTHLGTQAFTFCESLKNVRLSNSLKVIQESTFSGCTALLAIQIPESVETISDSAFMNCDSLTEVTIPANVKSLTGFSNCDNLVTVNLHNSHIGRGAFSGCAKLRDLVIPDSVTVIESSAFQLCNSLTEILIPSSVESIGDHAFYCCENLEKVVLNNGGIIDYYAFSECVNLKSVVINGNIEQIAMFAFSECRQLEEIILPDTVAQLGSCCFGECTALKNITFTGEAPSIYDDSFRNVTASAYYPGGLASWTEDKLQDYGGDLTWVSSHTHTYSSVVTPPTCTEQGYTTHTCSSCGEVTVDTYVAALGHDYAEPEFHENEKVHTYECTRCGDVKTENCSFDEGTVVREAELEQHGLKEYTCSVCGGSYRGEYVYRIYGDNRCATAYAAADMLKEVLDISKFDAIIIASGDNFADALAGSYLAAVKEAPILLYRSGFADDNLDYIQKNLASGGTVYILGGTAAVPQEMEDVLKNADISVERLFGNSRFATNLEILEKAGVEGKEILIATGWEFADSLSASATGLPILMVNNKSGKLTDEQVAFLRENRGSAYTIIGGTAAVSEEIQTAIEEVIGKKVDRVFGNSREATSVKVAQTYFSRPDYALLAYSRNFPDGLCGGPLAYALGAPLLLVNSGREADAAEYVDSNGIGKGAILGGTAVVTEENGRIVFGLE